MLFYRALLHLYPASWRADYGDEMRSVFAARRRDTSGFFGAVALWLEVLADLLTNAAAVQLDFAAQDLRSVWRTLGRSPGFAIAAVTIAALGIGASTAAFTMVNHVLIRPLPFAGQNRLVVDVTNTLINCVSGLKVPPDVPAELSIVEVGRMMGVPGWIM